MKLVGNRTEMRRFALFVMASGFSAVINLLTRVLLSEIVSYRWAVGLAYLVGMATAFALNKLLVFEDSGKSIGRELLWFSLVNLVGVVQVWSLSVGLAEYLFPRWHVDWHPELVAHVVGLSSLTITSYFGHKYLSFRGSSAG